MPPHTTRPPFFTAASAAGTSAPTGAKMIAASSASGGRSSEPPAQTSAERTGKILRGLVARTGEGINASALPRRDLDENVRRCAEAIEA